MIHFMQLVKLWIVLEQLPLISDDDEDICSHHDKTRRLTPVRLCFNPQQCFYMHTLLCDLQILSYQSAKPTFVAISGRKSKHRPAESFCRLTPKGNELEATPCRGLYVNLQWSSEKICFMNTLTSLLLRMHPLSFYQ